MRCQKDNIGGIKHLFLRKKQHDPTEFGQLCYNGAEKLAMEFIAAKTIKKEQHQQIAVAFGDGIGPEITDATLKVLHAAEARIDVLPVAIGQQAYDAGYKTGVTPKAWDDIRRTKVLLKAPVTAPPDSRYKSPNVIIRKMLGMYANVRPCISYAPFVPTHHPQMNVVIIRENEEDLYAGIEHRQTAEVTQCTKLISHSGSEKIIRYAFEYARSHFRKRVTCFTKDNILKMSDGLFHRIFNAVAQEYPDLEHEHWIVDLGTSRLAAYPESFDVLVAPNLYGDILNDMTAQLAGSVGMAGSANYGEECAMFETIHGSAPHRQGKDEANPSGMLLAAVMMLNHIGQPEVAEWIHNAWLCTLEDGMVTYDMFGSERPQTQVSTSRFAQEVIARLGEEPQHLPAVRYESNQFAFQIEPYSPPQVKKDLLGLDLFLDAPETRASALAQQLQTLLPERFKLSLISNRGVQVWPEGFSETFCTDHWRCRFLAQQNSISHQDLLELMRAVSQAGYDYIKTEYLYSYDGVPGFSNP